jgi:hypothetical protein
MPARRQPPSSAGFTISPATVKWGLSGVAALFAALVGYWQVMDRIDNHWRLESIQRAKEAQDAAELKALRDKLEAELREHKGNDVRTAAWTIWLIQDFRAAAEQKWAKDCVHLKYDAGMCSELEQQAAETRRQAIESKHKAEDVSKEKP